MEKRENISNASTSRSKAAVKPIYNITPFTLLDYPGHLACILWFAGCNMRCGYCYNPDLVFGKGKFSYEKALSFLESRRNYLDAVVLSGGECSLHKGLEGFITGVKQMGFKVKLDTNGMQPQVLSSLLRLNLLDMVALDYKAPAHLYKHITGYEGHGDFIQSLDILMISDVHFEVRTTWHPNLLSIEELQNMVKLVRQHGYSGKYVVQEFLRGVPTISDLPEPGSGENWKDLERAFPYAELRRTNGN